MEESWIFLFYFAPIVLGLVAGYALGRSTSRHPDWKNAWNEARYALIAMVVMHVLFAVLMGFMDDAGIGVLILFITTLIDGAISVAYMILRYIYFSFKSRKG